jgi:heme oxygenase
MASLLGDKSMAEELKLRRLHIENGEEKLSPPELQDYIDHLHKLSDEDPLLLLPYFYSMYGAITAGGSIIKRMVKRAFSLKTDSGVEMFHVSLEGSDFKNIAGFRGEMKRTLDEEMELSEKEK